MLTESGHEGRAYDLTGRETFTLAEAAVELSQATGRRIEFKDETVDEARESRSVFGAPDWEVEAWISSYVAIANGEMERVSPDVERLTGHPPKTLREYLAESSCPRPRTCAPLYQARVILHAPLEAVADRVPHSVGTLEAIDEHSCLLLTGSDWLGGLAVYVAEIGVDFEVLEPPEFVDRVRELAGRFGKAT